MAPSRRLDVSPVIALLDLREGSSIRGADLVIFGAQRHKWKGYFIDLVQTADQGYVVVEVLGLDVEAEIPFSQVSNTLEISNVL